MTYAQKSQFKICNQLIFHILQQILSKLTILNVFSEEIARKKEKWRRYHGKIITFLLKPVAMCSTGVFTLPVLGTVNRGCHFSNVFLYITSLFFEFGFQIIQAYQRNDFLQH